MQKKYNVILSNSEYYSQFQELLLKLSEIGKTVILIDDKCIYIFEFKDRNIGDYTVETLMV